MGESTNFQVDLRGIVDLLSHHLYTSERVYVRELLQNAVDAINARRSSDPEAPARVVVETDGATLTISDTGVGLAPHQVGEFLATIGRSSKRDELGFQREGFLGQFGIGLLSAFMVADEVRVVTQPVGEVATRWVGSADGTYVQETVADRDEPGTSVTLRPMRGAEHWFTPATVRDLVELFGAMLPYEITVNGEVVAGQALPWDRSAGPGRRAAEIAGFAQDVLGYTPFDVIDIDVPAAGLQGVALVLPFPANPAERATHRVYLKRMLLAEHAEGLVPDWAFFVRCVVDTTQLRPTANREALFDDSLLEETRQAIADQLRAWMVRLSSTQPDRLRRFLGIHHLGVLALALHDDEMLRLVDRWVAFETNRGRMTLASFRERYGAVRYVRTSEEFRSLAAVAAAQDITLLNGGYTYAADIVERLPQIDPGAEVAAFEPSELATSFHGIDPETERRLRDFMVLAQEAMEPVGCEVVVRAFDPATLPALYLVDSDVAFGAELRRTRDSVDGLWAGVLDALDDVPADEGLPQLVLNHRSPLIRRLAAIGDPDIVRLTIEGLYGQALLQGNHPVRPADAALINRSFLGLLDQAVPREKDAD
ncbi:MAG TPA: HSP90 family protein [Nocardioides sp.]|nr:HSP90 family protein [Nocardioides sp.]